MRIQVSGKQIDVGDALRTHVEDRMGEAVGKYFDRPVEAIVTFCKDRHEFSADASVHLSTGMTVQATARADEIYASFEGAVDRMEKQLRRYKRRLKDHHRDRSHPFEGADAPSYILEGGALEVHIGAILSTHILLGCNDFVTWYHASRGEKWRYGACWWK
jgi:ribosomal subunit interface protein